MVKCNLRFVIFSLGLFGNILNVKSQQTGDCGIFQNAIIDLGEENIQKYTINDCCNHSDITCENNSITKIKISNIRCDGIRFESIVSKFANLQHLTSFEISYTRDCTRSMPNNLSELKNLKSLILNDNGFDDSLPENISKISSLEKLDLSNNRFYGTIPACYSDLKNLKTLKLNGNRLSGAVPYNFSQLENLTELNLASNDLKGYIPKMSKVKICDYKKTDLCRLSSTTCNKDLRYCSKDDVRNSNAENGSPDPEAYEGDVQSIRLWFKKNAWKIPFIILLIFFGISISFICCGLGTMCCSCRCCRGDSEEISSSTTTTTGKSTLPSYIQLPPPTQKKSGFKWDGKGRPTYFNKSGHAVYTFKKNKF